jgi:hypothetical protein
VVNWKKLQQWKVCQIGFPTSTIFSGFFSQFVAIFHGLFSFGINRNWENLTCGTHRSTASTRVRARLSGCRSRVVAMRCGTASRACCVKGARGRGRDAPLSEADRRRARGRMLERLAPLLPFYAMSGELRRATTRTLLPSPCRRRCSPSSVSLCRSSPCRSSEPRVAARVIVVVPSTPPSTLLHPPPMSRDAVSSSSTAGWTPRRLLTLPELPLTRSAPLFSSTPPGR